MITRTLIYMSVHSHLNTPNACRYVFTHARSGLGGLINFYRLQPEQGGNGQANMLTTVQIHFTEDTKYTHTHTHAQFSIPHSLTVCLDRGCD